jgi:hypothetical protein
VSLSSPVESTSFSSTSPTAPSTDLLTQPDDQPVDPS